MAVAAGGSWERWDATTYQGMSLLSLLRLTARFHYSVLWCNNVNCLAVRDQELGGAHVDKTVDQLNTRRLDQHSCDDKNRSMAVIEENGTYEERSDGGMGSRHIRCNGCVAHIPCLYIAILTFVHGLAWVADI